MSKMTSEELQLHVLTQLILQYRASLETMSKIFNTSQSDIYSKVMKIDNDLIKKALIYVLDYETTEKNIVDQDEAKRNVRLFLIKLHHAKSGSEKLKVVKELDNDEEISKIKIKIKRGLDLTNGEIDTIIKYRYKYAIPRMTIQEKLGVERHVLERREKKQDEDFQKRLLKLNEYNEALRFMPKKGRSVR